MKTPFHRITSVAPSHSMRSNWMIAFLAAVGAVGAAQSASAGGGVRAWSSSTGNNWNKYSQSNVAADLGECTAVGAGQWHTLALRTDGTMRAWGWNNDGQCNIPDSAKSGVFAIAGSAFHTIALTVGTDCNVDSISDTVEIAQDPTLDRDLNGKLDSCDIAANPALDRNLNGVLDSYEIAQTPALDANANGILDNVDLAAANTQITALTAANTALTAQLNCGDLDGDGEVNGGDLGKMLISWGQCQ